MSTPLTAPQRQALAAVQAGQCFRQYHVTLHGPKGVGALALWSLIADGLITDEREREGADRIALVLTAKGREVLHR